MKLYPKEYELFFNSTFGKPLLRFWHPLFGFDIARFDDFMRTPDGKSLSDFITEKHGAAAQKLIQVLIAL